MENQKDVIREKLDYFLNSQAKVHVAKINKEYINGVLTSKINDDIYTIIDGVGTEHKLFVIECFKVDEFKDPTI